MNEWHCKICKEEGNLVASILHECPGPPLKICPRCNLVLPCECE